MGLDDNLDRMLEEREVNSFSLNQVGQLDETPEDAFIMYCYTAHPFILESVRSFDLPMDWRDKIDNKLVHFVCSSKHWSKYYYSKEPVYIFLCENEQDALETADLFYRRTESRENFRLITDDQVRLGLDKAKFSSTIPAPVISRGRPPRWVPCRP